MPTDVNGCQCVRSLKPYASVPVLSAPLLIPSHLLRVPRQSHLPAKDKSKNELKLGVVHIPPGIYFTAEKTPKKPQLRDCLRGIICEIEKYPCG